MKRRKGKRHIETKTAYTTFKDTCKKERARLQFTLPEILKYQPKKFWNMLRQKTADDIDISLEDFTEYNKKMFYKEDTPPDSYTPLTNPEDHLITQPELEAILVHKYKATKSRGLSTIPPQLLKFLGPAGISSLATFLNASAITQPPPPSWRAAKVIPLYKGKGDARNPENYRSIAIPPPFAKVFMATINHRLTATAHNLHLHAPT
jgi:hypothetical protein